MVAFDAYQEVETTGFSTRSAPAALRNNEAFQARQPDLGPFFADEESWEWASSPDQDFYRLARAHIEMARNAESEWFSRRYLLVVGEAVVTLWTRTSEPVTVWEYRRPTPEEMAGYLNHLH
jgi:hypothetical protein